MASEQELIARIARALSARSRARGGDVRLSIGDDAAVVRPRSGRELVFSCDAFLEGVHFLPKIHPAESVGYKALARATSDLAAMGARPRYFLLTLALPRKRAGTWLNRFLKGMAHAARSFGLMLIGGDTAHHPTVAISITVVGEEPPGRAVTRAGARPGDLIYVSGTLGRAQLGLELIHRGLKHHRRWQALLQHHFYPVPPLALGEMLARRKLASAMIDTSDGLSTDLAHICQSSGVGAELWRDQLPRVAVPPELVRHGINPLRLALHGGEDYELLFTVPPGRVGTIPLSFKGTKLTAIGEITKQRGMRLAGPGGRVTTLAAQGWDHFLNAGTIGRRAL